MSFLDKYFDRARNKWDGKQWDKLPTLLAIPKLITIRDALREHNLVDTGASPASPPTGPAPERPARTADGSFTDAADPAMGQAQTRFGRNMPLSAVHPEEAHQLLTPNPREISTRLLRRKEFIPATTLNLLAAAWVQFQTHDWFAHQNPEPGGETVDVPLPQGDLWPANPMKIGRTPRDPGWRASDGNPPAYLNRVTHWWDASQIYGSDVATQERLRSFEHGKLKIEGSGLLPRDAAGNELSGFTENWWVGLSMLHTLFVWEHNAICEQLRTKHPDWDDQRLFDTARLINAALIAKIHTVEWTPAILAHPTLEVAMNANWWGLAGEWLKKKLGRVGDDVVGGIVGGETDHHGAPFQMTEEFVAVYRMHPLMPDAFEFVDLEDKPVAKRTLTEVAFRGAREVMESVPLPELLYSFGIVHPGALVLHNYPTLLMDLHLPDGRTLDLAATEIVRDRERGVPRYNQFRRLLRLKPAESFKEITGGDEALADELEAVYGDVEQVDAMTGMFAEQPRPDGFGFSETAFRIFILMASRRLKSDRFFTEAFKPEVYTEEGIEWVNNNTMGSVLLRHCPQLMPVLVGQENAFKPWRRLGA
jgi:hypothetical protein